jgi:competence protein ComFC
MFYKFELDGVKGLAIYEYDETIRSLLYQFKGLYDIELKDVFLSKFQFYLRMKYRKFTLVPAPSNLDSEKERGFNHVKEMFSGLSLPFMDLFYKKIDYKQSDLNYYERQEVKEKIGIRVDVSLENKNILLVDDLMTTGSTLKAMINLLKPYKPKSVAILIMSHTLDPHKKDEKEENKPRLFTLI